MTLVGKDRRRLRSRAHPLDPVVIVGASGLTPSVLAEVDRALDDHELIKVRLASGDRAQRLDYIARICDELGAEQVQNIGRIAVLFRERVEES